MTFNSFYSLTPPMQSLKKINISRVLYVFIISLFLTVFGVVLYSVMKDVQLFWPSTAYWKNTKTKDNVLSSFSILKVEPFLGEKIVHLDLKGAPPSVSYLKKFFAYVKTFGVTGILIEYEDKFPYAGELEDIKALNAYTPANIKQILASAEANDLKVIPLIQLFGHFEYVLKLKKYEDFREVENFPQAICPSHKNVQSLIQKMISQVLKSHPKASYIHIGCDEVYHLGLCDKCKNNMKQNNWTHGHLYLNHVKEIATYISKTYPNVRPIIWGDHIIKFQKKVVHEFELPNLVDVMIWNYKTNVYKEAENFLKVYGSHFKNLWVAAAFKGATGFDKYVTDGRHHLQNQVSWLGVITKWKKAINFKGIILTGWQRYDHFSELCELLPVAIPSLIIDLLYLQDPIEGINLSHVLRALQCKSPIAFYPGDTKYLSISNCSFPGFKIYKLVNDLYHRVALKGYPQNHIKRTDLNLYNVVNTFGNSYILSYLMNIWPGNEISADLNILRKDLTKALLKVYDEYTVDEWISTRIIPVQIKLNAINIVMKNLLEKRVWPKRPFSINMSETLENIANTVCSANNQFGCPLLFI